MSRDTHRSSYDRACLRGGRARRLDRPRRRGSILIVTMAILLILAAFVLVFARSMRVEAIASANAASAAKASAIERGAEQYCVAMLLAQDTKDDVFELDDTNYAGVPLGDGYFWLVCPDYDDPSLPFYGFVAESAKLNINGVTGTTPAVDPNTIVSMFMGLPGVTPDMAASLVDWRDADDNPTTSNGGNGSESDYYMSLPNPYHAKNSTFESVEEILLVRGFTRQLLYGTLGASGAPSPQQQLMSGSNGIGGSGNTGAAGALASGNMMATNSLITDRDLALGINDLLTVYSAENATTGGGGGGGRGGGAAQTTVVRGRININRAPAEVLMCLPGLDQNDVATIQGKRTGLSTPDDISWVQQTLGGKYDEIRNLITGTTNQFSADIVAVSGDGRAFRRVKVVFDARSATAQPKIVYRRDITDQGWPLDPEILSSLRQGAGLPSSAYLPPPRRLPQ